MLLQVDIVDGLSYFMILMGVITFLALQFLEAPYGRYYSEQWGPSLHGKTAWFLMELPSLSIALLTFLYSYRTLPAEICVLFLCFISHYFNRTLIFPFLIRGGKRSSLLAFLCAAFFTIYNGSLQSVSLILQSDEGKIQPQLYFFTGIVIFLLGMVINIHSDHVLRNLRKPGETGYKIPKGGMFEYVSGANFFGEIIEWSGFAIASGSLAGFAFAFYSASNLVPRGISHHRWYTQKFDDYPVKRKAVIPFLL